MRRINLALQGGGAHGAFTWGVLDALLEQPTLEFGWISGTSAGAVNAAAVASGLAVNGADGARATLARLWTRVVDVAVPDAVKLNPLLALPWEALARSGTLAQMATLVSPYDFNPLGFDPLRDILNAEVDCARIAATAGPGLLIAATDIETGRARLFRRHEISVDVILASACLPTLSRAVEIEGRAYWDGGFSANPDLLTLATESPVSDTLIVQLSPLRKSQRPTSARDIAALMSHHTFNRPYVDHLRRIAEIRRHHADRPRWFPWRPATASADARIATHRFHMIDAGRHTASLAAGSQTKPDTAAVTRLFHAGRSEGAKWLDRCAADIGVRDTAEIAARIG